MTVSIEIETRGTEKRLRITVTSATGESDSDYIPLSQLRDALAE